MSELANIVAFSRKAPSTAQGPLMEVLSECGDYIARSLMKDSVPLESEQVWCFDLATASEELGSLQAELNEWRVLFITIENVDQEFEFLLTLTTLVGRNWITRFLPWNVAKSLKDDLKEVFHSQKFLKIVRTDSCEQLIVLDLAGLLSVLSAHSLVEISTWEYRRLNYTVMDIEDDVTLLQGILELFIGPLCAREAADAVISLPSPLDPPLSFVAWQITRRALSLPLFFFHALIACHGYVQGPSQLSSDPDQRHLAIADYINNSGAVSNPWLPALGEDPDFDDRQLWTNWLSPEQVGVPWGRSTPSAGIKAQRRNGVGELELCIHPTEDDMAIIGESDLEVRQQQADRERVKALMTRFEGKPLYTSRLPELDTIEEDVVDPFGPIVPEDEPINVGQPAEPVTPQDEFVDVEQFNEDGETINNNATVATHSSQNSETSKRELIIDLEINVVDVLQEEEETENPSRSDDSMLELQVENDDVQREASDPLQEAVGIQNLGETGDKVGGDEWRCREDRENMELLEVVEQRRILGEDLIAEIPRFPSPWRYVPPPEILPPANTSRSVNDSLHYHPLVDRPFEGSFSQHAVHRRLWEHLPPARAFMLKTPRGVPLKRIHHNHFRTRRGMGSTRFWLGSLCKVCGQLRHLPRACILRVLPSNPAATLPCSYCRKQHPVAICVMLHTRCQRCDRLGHYPSLCDQHSPKEWYAYFLQYVHLGLLTGTNELGPELGRFGFGPTGKDVSDSAKIRILEAAASRKIQGTLIMMSNKRKEYVHKLSFVLDPYFLVPETHVARARLILMLRGTYIREPGLFKREVFERIAKLEAYEKMTTPWLPFPPGQRPFTLQEHEKKG